ncbi:guanylate-binding protein 3-like isoform X3 [Petromyzon marinus]|nr:guanylate-binding protein 5-like isoform X3 [Petromyzon marinus]XP_032816174.1 guanylate-binding protein 5-like isoform X3 [Petromyzon marinus]XP_032816175.1 guanylate-binding protein 5-like isoform X3 [Petromyzon marinus]
MEKPLHFIRSDADGKFVVDESVATQLALLPEGPAEVVAIIGSSRTGKSYLLSRFFGWGKGGFETGASTRPVTRGVWLWSREHPLRPDARLVLLDTEGLDEPSTAEGRDYDYKLFSLTVLLASCVLYNTVGKIQRSDIDALRIVLKLSEYIRLKPAPGTHSGTGHGEELAGSLCWVMRDFHLALDSTPDKYMEEAFSRFESSSEGKLVDSLRKYFPVRRCFPLSTPLANAAQLGELDNMSPSELNEDFRRQAEDMISTVLTSVVSPKRIMSDDGSIRTLDPLQFVTVAQHYVAALNAGDQPCVQDAYLALLEWDARRASAEALQARRAELEVRLGGADPPHGPAVLARALAAAHSAGVSAFVMRLAELGLHNETPGFLPGFLSELTAEQEEDWKHNEKLSRERSAAALKEMARAALGDEGAFMVPGGHLQLVLAMLRLVHEFSERKDLGPCAAEALAEFRESRCAPLEAAVSRSDAEMTQMEKERAERRVAEEKEKIREQTREETKQKYKQQMRENEEKHLEAVTKYKMEAQQVCGEMEKLREEKERELGEVKAQHRTELERLEETHRDTVRRFQKQENTAAAPRQQRRKIPLMCLSKQSQD